MTNYFSVIVCVAMFCKVADIKKRESDAYYIHVYACFSSIQAIYTNLS
jgi:hypothetical protein